MKVQIRQNTFETNSSSMHSLVVRKDGHTYDENEIRDEMYLFNEKWNIYGDLYFGRSPFQCLTTFEAKTRYAIASLCGYSNNAAETFETIKEIILRRVPQCKEVIIPKSWVGETNYGGVDENILSGFLDKENITLEEFLTNSKYIVIVDGDEYCIWNSMKKSGLVKMDEILREYPGGDD